MARYLAPDPARAAAALGSPAKIVQGDFMSEETVEVDDVTIEAETDLALLCNINEKKHWIPKSVVHEDSEVSSEGDTGTIVIMRWFAEKEGLV